jgi:hypothetical protein
LRHRRPLDLRAAKGSEADQPRRRNRAHHATLVGRKDDRLRLLVEEIADIATTTVRPKRMAPRGSVGG